MEALYQVNLQLSKEYKSYLTDVMKVLVTMVMYHVIGNLITHGPSLLPESAMLSILLVIAGLSVYHLIFTKIVQFHLQ